jgi:putative spermidine/putrescine transport system substrate-binding protein
MSAAGTIPAEIAEQLPSTEGAFFPSIEEIDAAKAVIVEGWDSTVGVTVVTTAG